MIAPIDTLLTVETPEGTAITLHPAGFPARALAFVIDALIRVTVLIACGSALGARGHFATGAFFVLIFAVNWLYGAVFEMLPAAATPGKRILGLQVVMADGLPITPAACLTRNLLRAVDFLPLLYAGGILCLLLRWDARRVGDLAAGTLVVHRAARVPPQALAAGEAVEPPVVLGVRQRAAISAFAWRCARLTPERAEEIAALAAPVLGDDPSRTPMTQRLLGVARWLHGFPA